MKNNKVGDLIKFTYSDYKKLKRRKRFLNKINYRNHLKLLSEICKGYPTPAIPLDKYGNYVPDEEWFVWFPNDKRNDISYYQRIYRGNHNGNRYQFYKNYGNKVVRKCREEINDGGHYKKIFDYWWTVD